MPFILAHAKRDPVNATRAFGICVSLYSKRFLQLFPTPMRWGDGGADITARSSFQTSSRARSSFSAEVAADETRSAPRTTSATRRRKSRSPPPRAEASTKTSFKKKQRKRIFDCSLRPGYLIIEMSGSRAQLSFIEKDIDFFVIISLCPSLIHVSRSQIIGIQNEESVVVSLRLSETNMLPCIKNKVSKPLRSQI